MYKAQRGTINIDKETFQSRHGPILFNRGMCQLLSLGASFWTQASSVIFVILDFHIT